MQAKSCAFVVQTRHLSNPRNRQTDRGVFMKVPDVPQGVCTRANSEYHTLFSGWLPIMILVTRPNVGRCNFTPETISIYNYVGHLIPHIAAVSARIIENA